jgi:hypothetical protein
LSQLHVLLIWIQSLIAPILIAMLVSNIWIAGALCFVPSFGIWCLLFIAGQFEQPFGNDANDLALSVMQFEMNNSLLMLLDPQSIRAPSLKDHAKAEVGMLRKMLGDVNSSTAKEKLLYYVDEEVKNKILSERTVKKGRASMHQQKDSATMLRQRRDNLAQSPDRWSCFSKFSTQSPAVQAVHSGVKSFGQGHPHPSTSNNLNNFWRQESLRSWFSTASHFAPSQEDSPSEDASDSKIGRSSQMSVSSKKVMQGCNGTDASAETPRPVKLERRSSAEELQTTRRAVKNQTIRRASAATGPIPDINGFDHITMGHTASMSSTARPAGDLSPTSSTARPTGDLSSWP